MPNKTYVVGYKTPPKANMFKPGVSGNPRGRPRTINNFRQKFDKEMHEKIPLKDGSGQIDKASAVTKVLINKAIKGDMQAVIVSQKKRLNSVIAIFINMFGE